VPGLSTASRPSQHTRASPRGLRRPCARAASHCPSHPFRPSHVHHRAPTQQGCAGRQAGGGSTTMQLGFQRYNAVAQRCPRNATPPLSQSHTQNRTQTSAVHAVVNPWACPMPCPHAGYTLTRFNRKPPQIGPPPYAHRHPPPPPPPLGNATHSSCAGICTAESWWVQYLGWWTQSGVEMIGVGRGCSQPTSKERPHKTSTPPTIHQNHSKLSTHPTAPHLPSLHRSTLLSFWSWLRHCQGWSHWTWPALPASRAGQPCSVQRFFAIQMKPTGGKRVR
jgi:hypothetical protein